MSERCPECDGPLVREGTYCRACGWDADLPGDHLDGVDLPDDVDYDEVLGREGLSPRDPDVPAPRWVTLLWVLVVAAAAAGTLWKLAG